MAGAREERSATAAVLILLHSGTTQFSCPLLCLPSSLPSNEGSGAVQFVQARALQCTPHCPLLHLLYYYLISISFHSILSSPFLLHETSTRPSIHLSIRPSIHLSIRPSIQETVGRLSNEVEDETNVAHCCLCL